MHMFSVRTVKRSCWLALSRCVALSARKTKLKLLNKIHAKLKPILSSIQNNRNCSAYTVSVHRAVALQTHTRWTIKMKNRKRTEPSRPFASFTSLTVCMHVRYKFHRMHVSCDLCEDFIKYLDGIERFWQNYIYVNAILACIVLAWLFGKYSKLPHTHLYLSICRIYFSSIKMTGRGGSGDGGGCNDVGRP